MKIILTAFALIATGTMALAQGYGTGSNPSSGYVGGYTNSRGTTVQPYYRTSPNGTTYDNYDTRGNYNPHNGTYGTRNPY